MDTPVTIRRNPPRKAKLSSADKSTFKENRSTRKRYVAEGKALMPSFTAVEEIPKQIRKGCSPENLQGDNRKLDSALQQSNEYSRDHCAAAANPAHNSITNPTNVAEIEISTTVAHVENVAGLARVGFEAENLQCEASTTKAKTKQVSGKVRVFLRIRPAYVARSTDITVRTSKIAYLTKQHVKRPREETLNAPDVCLWTQSQDSVTLVTPSTLSASHKPKAEDFNGFTRIFNPDSTQEDIFNEILAPRLVDLLQGKSSVVVAMGPTSAGKTHTMLGTQADPGLLPQSLQYLLGANLVKNASSTVVVISMFEIYSEQGGRFEKILDLLQDGEELSLQQSKIKGLYEAMVYTVEEAKAFLSCGLQKRTTASTAANRQSSRSHCIVNISTCEITSDGGLSKKGTITIADLAGFERERKTKNQGTRLNESSFINNTAMVFGQCLRALLEHQKNPKKVLQRHFQYSMLTRYLKPYMEANGDMTLIVNVSPCEEDYLDTAFVLRQVAPYSSIRVTLLPTTKDTVENLADEKETLSLKERQQPVKKRRKVVGASNASCVSLVDCSNINNLEAKSKSLPEAREDSGKSDPITSCSHTTSELTATFLAEVNNVLVREGVKSADRVSLAVTKVLDTAAKCIKDLEVRLLQQHAQITVLNTNLAEERKKSYSLLMELKTLRECRDDLESQDLRLEKTLLCYDVDHSRPSVSGKGHEPSESNAQNVEGSHAQMRDCTAQVVDTDLPSVSAIKHEPFGLNTQTMEESHAQMRDSTAEGLDVDLPILAACSSPILDKYLCDFDRDGRGAHTNSRADHHVDWQIRDDSCRNNSGRRSSIEVWLTDKTVSSSDDKQDIKLVVGDSEDDLESNPSSTLPSKVQCSFSSSPKGTTEGQMASPLACKAYEDIDDQQEACHKCAQILEVSTSNLEVNEVTPKERVKAIEDKVKQTSPHTMALDGDSKWRVSDHKDCFQIEQSKESLSPCVEELGLHEGQLTCGASVEKAGSGQSCQEERNNSNFQKGRLLALTLLQGNKQPDEAQNDHDLPSMEQLSSTPIGMGTIGPIGHDLEEVLKIPLSELEKELWIPEAANSSRSSDILAKCNCFLETNQFPQRWSQQRANCLRYCLAVICGKMNVDGEWLPLSKEKRSLRKRHFYGVIQARTVNEAAGHARAGFQMETHSNSSESQRTENVGRRGGNTAAKSGNSIVDAQDNKENNTSFVSKTGNAPKRRRLQPLSALSLRAAYDIHSDMNFVDVTSEDMDGSKSALEEHQSNSKSLAYLLMHRNM